jgi:hypothetical protein
MRIPYLHLLDRCVVSLIKECNSGKIQTDPKTVEFIRHLRTLDRPGDYFSPLLSIVEGEHGREDTADEKRSCQRKESEHVRRFFRSASTDSNYLDACSGMVGITFTENRESAWDAREQFLRIAAPLIAKGVKKEQRKSIEHELVASAQSACLSAGDPVVVLCLACLYGSDHARSVIKPKELPLYNVLNDVHTLSRVGLIQALIQQNRIPLKTNFISRDKGLVKTRSHIDITELKLTGDGYLQCMMRYRPELFPALSEIDYLALMDRIMPTEP